MRILANVPVLPSTDLQRSESFYARLGYAAVRRYPDYLILACSAAELHLSLSSLDPATNTAGVYLRVAGIRDLAEKLGAEAVAKPWGQIEFSITDPDNNLLRVGEPVAR